MFLDSVKRRGFVFKALAGKRGKKLPREALR